MPQNKRILFSKELQRQARFAQVMCHPVRISILKLLNLNDFLLCCEIVNLLPYSQVGVSHHLEVMLCSEIIERIEKFGAVGYQVNTMGCNVAKESFEQIISILEV